MEQIINPRSVPSPARGPGGATRSPPAPRTPVDPTPPQVSQVFSVERGGTSTEVRTRVSGGGAALPRCLWGGGAGALWEVEAAAGVPAAAPAGAGVSLCFWGAALER